MDSWEWPREFWDLTPPWEAEDFDAFEADYVEEEARYTEAGWDEVPEKRLFVSLEELEDLEEEALWEEEFDLDDPTHLYLYMDEYEYLQQFKQPELRDLLEEEVWTEDQAESSIQEPASNDPNDAPSSETSRSANPPPHDDEDTPR
jgi:hypothetical protein